MTRSFDAYFDLRLNKRLCKQSWGWWFETLLCPLWRHSNVSIIPFWFWMYDTVIVSDMQNPIFIKHISGKVTLNKIGMVEIKPPQVPGYKTNHKVKPQTWPINNWKSIALTQHCGYWWFAAEASVFSIRSADQISDTWYQSKQHD